jgi:hypothetical protein
VVLSTSAWPYSGQIGAAHQGFEEFGPARLILSLRQFAVVESRTKRRRAGAWYGILLRWLGVLVLAVLAPLPERTPLQDMEHLYKRRGTFKASEWEKKQAEIQARIDTEDAAAKQAAAR